FLAVMFGVSKSISDSMAELVADNGSISYCVSPYLYNSIGLIARDINSKKIIVIPTGGYTFSYAPCQ
ncbi:MAG: hypothetical protein KJ834_18365, partial [Alphaproteobacteria bacterium]|nr:hypothetical protein [Alphaproteobacteria bacterium]